MGLPYNLAQTLWCGREAPYISTSESSYSVNFTIDESNYTAIGIKNMGSPNGYCLVATPENSSTPEILYSSGTMSWPSGAPYISFVGGEDIANSDLLDLANTCFWATDLSNSCWRWSDSCTFQDYVSVNCEFTSGGASYYSIEGNEGYLYYTDAQYQQVTVYDDNNGGWVSDDYKTITIVDTWGYDEDVDSALRQDASMMFLDPPDVIISYKGAEIATMSDSGTKTLQTQGKYCEGDIVVSYTKSGGGGGGGGSGLRLAWAHFYGAWTSIGDSNWTKTVTIDGVTDDDFVQCFPAPSNNTNGRLVSVYTHTSGSVTLVFYSSSTSVNFDSTLVFAIMEASADIAYACGSTYGLTQTTFTPGDTVTFTNTATGAQRVIVTINRMTTGAILTSATLDYGQTLTFTMPKGGVFIKTASTGGGND